MYKVYIADDEAIVRQGLKIILDWNELGFEVCGESGDGITAYQEITALNPDLLLVDILMPKLKGLDLANRLRSSGYNGRIIVLSGYSEFKYAQEAIMYDVDYYLTKPIEEDELKEAVLNIYATLRDTQKKTKSFSYYQEKAKNKIVEDIIKNENYDLTNPDLSLQELGFDSDMYQILILNKYDSKYQAYQNFINETGVIDPTEIEFIQEDTYDILILKGSRLIGKIADHLDRHRYDKDKQYYVAVGSIASEVSELHSSYDVAMNICRRSFFSEEKKFLETSTPVTIKPLTIENISAENSREMGKKLHHAIIQRNLNLCEKYIDELFARFSSSENTEHSLKNYLAGMYIFIVNEIKTDYYQYNVEFKTNAEIINLIQNKTYLFEILDYIKSEIKSIIMQTRDFSSGEIMSEITSYIDAHIGEDIKLKNIAPKFGYNSCYLGKIFSVKFNMSFNDYVHQVRIEKAKHLLLESKSKVYEIAAIVGYGKVDYFHAIFKKLVGCSPNEYRAQLTIDIE